MKFNISNSSTGVGKVESKKRSKRSSTLSMVDGPKAKDISPLQPRESPEESEERLVRKKRKTNSSRALEFSEGSQPALDPRVMEIDSPDSKQVLNVIPISLSSPNENTMFVFPSASPIGPQYDPIGIAAHTTLEVRKAHSDQPTDAPSTSGKFDFKSALNSVVETASSVLTQEGLVSLIQHSCGDAETVQFCRLILLKLVEANKARHAAEGVTTRVLAEREAVEAKNKKDLAAAQSEIKDLQDQKERFLKGMQELSKENKQLQRERDLLVDGKKGLQALLDQNNESLKSVLKEKDDLCAKVCQLKSDVEAQDKLMESKLDKLVEQSHRRYQILCNVNCARYYSYGWEDRVKEPSDRKFPNGPSKCNESAGVEDGIYDHVYYMRKHDLVIDYLGDEMEWKNPQTEVEIPEAQKEILTPQESTSEAASGTAAASNSLLESSNPRPTQVSAPAIDSPTFSEDIQGEFGSISELICEKSDIHGEIKLKYPPIRRTPWMDLPRLYGDNFESIIGEKLRESQRITDYLLSIGRKAGHSGGLGHRDTRGLRSNFNKITIRRMSFTKSGPACPTFSWHDRFYGK